jgi:hypothetical protein
MSKEITLSVSLDVVEDLFVSPTLNPLKGRFETQSGIDRLIALLPPKRGPENVTIAISAGPDATGSTPPATEVTAAFDGYARQRISDLIAARKRLKTRGLKELFFGLLFLAVCLAISSALSAIDFGTPWLTQFYSEGLIIVGWIALWHPVDLLLFERWPLNREIGALERLRLATLTVNATASAP